MSLLPRATGFAVAIRRGDVALRPADPARHGRFAVAMPGLHVQVLYRDDVVMLRDAAQGRTLFLHGRIYNRTAAELLGAFATGGAGCARDFNGSFALLLVDERRRKVWLLSDRLGTRPLFLRVSSDCALYATCLLDLAREDDDVDPIGVAWYLSNGVVHGNRTVLRGVERLDGAVCHAIATDEWIKRDSYWRIDTTDEYAGREDGSLRRELAELLVECVRQHLPASEAVHVSLSAGFDVSGIAGIAAALLRFPALQSFSYGLDEGMAGSDARMARVMAERLGLPHRFYRSHNGDIVGAIERNARWGDGLANFSDESLAWESLANHIGDARPRLFVGEHFFGRGPLAEQSDDGVLKACEISRLSGLPWLQGFMGAERFKCLAEGQAEDIEAMLRRAGRASARDVTRRHLYLEQKLPRRLMPWRTNFAGRLFEVVNPWLDNALLDFMRKVPYRCRVGKRLYKETISELLPEVFALPRATRCGYIANWPDELAGAKTVLAATHLAKGSTCPLDDCIDPDKVRACLMKLDRSPTSQAALRPRGCATIIGRTAARLRLYAGLAPRYGPPQREVAARFLLRYFVLRRFVGLAQEQNRGAIMAGRGWIAEA